MLSFSSLAMPQPISKVCTGDPPLRLMSNMPQKSLEKQPKKMVVVGSGAIGVEFAYFYNSMGTEVTIVEFLPNVVFELMKMRLVAKGLVESHQDCLRDDDCAMATGTTGCYGYVCPPLFLYGHVLLCFLYNPRTQIRFLCAHTTELVTWQWLCQSDRIILTS